MVICYAVNVNNNAYSGYKRYMVTRNYFAFLYRILVEMAANNVISFVKVRRFMRLE